MAKLHDLVNASDEWLAGAGPVDVDAVVARRLGIHENSAMVVLLEFELDIVRALTDDVGLKDSQDPFCSDWVGVFVETGLQEIVV